MSWQYPQNKKKKEDKFVLITSFEQCCLTAKDIKLNSILILQKWCQGLIFSLQVHWLINMRERTVIIGWKWHQKLSKLWKGLPLNGFEPWIKKTINWEEAGVILTAQNKTNREGEVSERARVRVCVLVRGGGDAGVCCYLWTIPCHYGGKVYSADFPEFQCCDLLLFPSSIIKHWNEFMFPVHLLPGHCHRALICVRPRCQSFPFQECAKLMRSCKICTV